MVSDEKIILAKIAEAEKLEEEAKAHVKKYKKMSYVEVLQEPENLERLERNERMQRNSFEGCIKKHYPDKLKKWEELFEKYFEEYLKGRAHNIYEYTKRILGGRVGKHED